MRKRLHQWIPCILAALLSLMLLTGCAAVKGMEQGATLSAGETAVSPTELLPAAPTPMASLRAAAREAAQKTAGKPSRSVPAVTPRRNGYGIVVYKGSQSVAVYGPDAQGQYTVPVKVFTCSTGNPLSRTPDGKYQIRAKYRWRLLVGGVYGQYCSSISRSYLFHSVPYYAKDASTLENEEYDKLGSPASKGCIRMCVRDCKWIYDNCPIGTEVRIVSESGPYGLGVPHRQADAVYSGWDPSDRWAEGNPYFNASVTTASATSTATTASATSTTASTATAPSTAAKTSATTASTAPSEPSSEAPAATTSASAAENP